MAAASTMPWPQQLFACFGGSRLPPAPEDACPGSARLQREDSAHQSVGSSGVLTRSAKSSGSSDGGAAHRGIAQSDPAPRRRLSGGADEAFPGSVRSASLRPRPDSSAALRQHSRPHRSRDAEQPRSHAAELEDWHQLRRFAFVGDIASSPGAGSYTKLMLNRKEEILVSIKFLDLRRGAVDGATVGELLNHRRLNSQHVARFKEAFVTDNYLAVVTENAGGGSLLRHIRHRGRLAEAEARKYFRQLLAAVAHCHSRGVYHRDLRLDAMRLDHAGNLLLGDFGYSSAKLTNSGELADMSNPAASPAYTPPEVLLGHAIVNASYDGEVLDIWACGVILFAMVFGVFPFEDAARSDDPRSARSVVRRLVRLQYSFPAPASEEVRDLLSRVFVATKTKRIDLAGLAAHPWVTDGGALPPVPVVGSPLATPRSGERVPQMDLLTGPRTPLAAASSASGQAIPESPPAGDTTRSPSGGFFRRREKSQTEADICAVVKRALKSN